MMTNQNHTPRLLDLDAVHAFTLVASLASFTRAAEASGTTQSAISLKLKRLEAFLGRRLIERTPRSVRLTADGDAFLAHATELLAANTAALVTSERERPRLRIGISDHALGGNLPALLSRMNRAEPTLALDVDIGFSRAVLDAFDSGSYDAVVVRREAGRRGGEVLADDAFGWMAMPALRCRAGEPLPLATLAPPCGVRAVALQVLKTARRPWQETVTGGGVTAVAAAVEAGLAIAPLAVRIAPPGSHDIGPRLGLPPLPSSKVMLYSRVSDPPRRAALRVLAAAFRGGSV